MHSITISVDQEDTTASVIKKIYEQEGIKEDTFFGFSCLLKPGQLKINCLDEDNPYTPRTMIEELYKKPKKDIMYVVAPLEQYFIVFRPMLHKMISKVYPVYCKAIPEKEEMMSILSLTIVQLYNKGYYLHNNLIFKSFICALNMHIRKSKKFQDANSLDQNMGSNEDGTELLLSDFIADEAATEEAHNLTHYTEKDLKQDVFEYVKKKMLESMSQLSFDRIMIQIKSNTIDSTTSERLRKYREGTEYGHKRCK